MKTFCLGLLGAFALASSAHATAFQFNSVTTYSQETQGSSIGLLTHIQATLPIAVDLANVNEATSFRINANTMWAGTTFQILLGQDPTYKPGATKATINTPAGNVQLSWTATNLTFSGVLADNATFFGLPGFSTTPIPLGTNGPFLSTNSLISIHFQYSDFTHVAMITGTNKLVLISSTIPGFPGPFFVVVNTGKFNMTADLVPPTIKFNSPAQNAVVTNDNVNVDLTVSDNVSLGVGPLSLGAGAPLSYSANGGQFLGDPGANAGDTTNRHSLNLSGLIFPGTNIITFIAADSSGNLATNKLVLFFSQRSPITLITNGVGGFTGIANGQMLEIGRNYTITAKPGTGQVLTAWQDGLNNLLGRNNKLVFTMTDGLTLIGSFAESPFTSLQGTYLGYFLPSIINTNASQFGSIKIDLGASGSFSGTLNSGAGSQTFGGQFLYNSNGVQDSFILVTSKSSTNGLHLLLTTDSGSPDYGLIQGSVGFGVNGVRTRTSANFGSADVTAARQTNATVISGPGVFHYSVNPTTNEGVFPQGFGFGTLTVKADGTVTGSLSLADGDAPTTTFSSHLVYHNGYVPIFVPLYNKGGGFLMTLNMGVVAADGTAQNAATATWVKPSGKPFYPNGFAIENEIDVARFTSVLKNAPNGVTGIELDSAGILLGSSIAMVNGAFAATSVDESHTKGTINSTGNMSGKFLDNGITRTFKGLVVESTPNQVQAFGFFVRSNQTGNVVVEFNSP